MNFAAYIGWTIGIFISLLGIFFIAGSLLEKERRAALVGTLFLFFFCAAWFSLFMLIPAWRDPMPWIGVTCIISAAAVFFCPLEDKEH